MTMNYQNGLVVSRKSGDISFDYNGGKLIEEMRR